MRTCQISPQGLLTEETLSAGSVGIVRPMPTGTIYCSLLKIGHIATSGNHTLADGETWVNETFATSLTPSYDAAGNMTYDGIYNYTYDAWNRLLEVRRLGPTGVDGNGNPLAQKIGTYRYDGLGRRIYKHVTNSGDRNLAESYYYDNKWRPLEARKVTLDTNGNPVSDQAARQFVWGTQYIDELICMDVDTDGDGSCTDEHESSPKYGYERYRYFQDANWNVVGIWAEHAAKVVERYEYDPYGTCRIFRGWDSSAGCESGSVIGESLVPGGNPIRFAGYYFDDETGVYQVRHRMYSPGLQRWLQRDPATAC